MLIPPVCYDVAAQKRSPDCSVLLHRQFHHTMFSKFVYQNVTVPIPAGCTKMQNRIYPFSPQPRSEVQVQSLSNNSKTLVFIV